MQNEILKPVLETDETAIPRYDIVNPDGSISQRNVELRLKNEVMQEGTPYDSESVLPTTLLNELGLPTSATPAQAFQAILIKLRNVFTKSETLSEVTAALFGLGADAVPDDVFSVIKVVLNNNTNDISALKASGAKIETGSYVGTGSTTNTLQFSNNPQIVIITDGTAGINPKNGWNDGSGIILVRTQTFAVINTLKVPVTFSGNKLTLTCDQGSQYAYNRSGTTYHYQAIS